MKKINILKPNSEFQRIISKYKPYQFKDYIIYYEKNTKDNYKFGISVSKKIGNAVLRNKLKRQIKNIIVKNNYQNNFNCIIIIRRSILNLSFKEKEEELNNIFKKLNILKEK